MRLMLIGTSGSRNLFVQLRRYIFVFYQYHRHSNYVNRWANSARTEQLWSTLKVTGTWSPLRFPRVPESELIIILSFLLCYFVGFRFLHFL